MKNRFLTSLAAAGIGAAVLLSGPSFAGDGGDRGPDRMMEQMTEVLELSDVQKTRIQGVLAQGREAGAADRERIRALRESLRAGRDSFDANQVKAATDELGEITGRMAYRRTETQYQIRELLNDEQRVELDEMMEQRKDRMKHKRRGKGNAFAGDK